MLNLVDKYVRSPEFESPNGLCTKHKHVCFTWVGKTFHIARNEVVGSCSYHAETALLKKIKNSRRVKTIYVAKIRQPFGYGMSLPCNDCQVYLKRYTNVKTIYYTNKNGEWEKVNLDKLTPCSLETKYHVDNTNRVRRRLKT